MGVLDVFQGSAALDQSTGDQNLPNSGVTGKIALYEVGQMTADGVTSGIEHSIGMATATEQCQVAVAAADNTNASAHFYSNSSAGSLIDDVPSPAILREFDHKQFNAGDTDITHTTVNAQDNVLTYTILGGTGILNAKIVKVASKTSAGQQLITSVGFKGNWCKQITVSTGTIDTVAATHIVGVGETDGTVQYATGNIINDGASISKKVIDDGSFIFTTATGAVLLRANMVEFTSNGFELNWSVFSASARDIFYLVVEFDLSVVGIDMWDDVNPTVTGDDTITTGTTLVPEYSSLYGAFAPTFSTSQIAGAVLQVGHATRTGLNQSARTYTSGDGSNSRKPMGLEQDNWLLLYTTITTLLLRAAVTSFNAGSITINADTADAVARPIFGTALGIVAAPPVTGGAAMTQVIG